MFMIHPASQTTEAAARWTPAERAERFVENYTERGATARSWLCGQCGADVDSADLEIHLRVHDDEKQADVLHASMLAEATATIEATMGLPLSDAAALDLLLVGVAVTSAEGVAAIVSGIVGDEVDDVTFAGMVDALMRIGE